MLSEKEKSKSPYKNILLFGANGRLGKKILKELDADIKSIYRMFRLFQGDLGSGKTTLCKNICASLGVPINLVTSPTYTMVNMYSYNSRVIHHLDLYRLEDQNELEDFDFEDLIAVDGITLVE